MTRHRTSILAPSLALVALLLSACGVVQVGVVPTPTPTPSYLHYANAEYGFAFTYPSSWSLDEGDHVVRLCHRGPCLTVAYKWPTEARSIAWGGGAAGDFVYGGKLTFMGTTIDAQLVVYEKAYKVLIYHTPAPLNANDAAFAITLDDTSVDYNSVDLSDALIGEATTIVESFEALPRPAPSPATPLPAESPTPVASEPSDGLAPPALGIASVRTVDGATMVFVPGGSFVMGLDETKRQTAQALCTALEADAGPSCGLRGLRTEPQRPAFRLLDRPYRGDERRLREVRGRSSLPHQASARGRQRGWRRAPGPRPLRRR